MLPVAALACAGAATLAALGAAGAGAAARPAPRPAVQVPAQYLRVPRYAAANGQYVSFLFSKTEQTAADNCVPDDAGIARLDTVVAPYLRSFGMIGTGTLITAKTQNSRYLCTHNDQSLADSWSGAARLAENFGWSFGSATATYPGNLTKLTPAEQYAQTCGSAATIDAHGLPGAHGIIDYPGAQQPPVAIQEKYGSQCFAWGRLYAKSGTTSEEDAHIPPYWQLTKALNGGHCDQQGAPCAKIGGPRYTPPGTIIKLIDKLKPGEWLTIQAYLLATGTNPPYTTNGDRWDCTSSDPNLHWSNDNERYCYSDWQQIVQAVAARRDILVTDPLTVGIAFGRPSHYK
jgi:hypothetical protein